MADQTPSRAVLYTTAPKVLLVDSTKRVSEATVLLTMAFFSLKTTVLPAVAPEVALLDSTKVTSGATAGRTAREGA